MELRKLMFSMSRKLARFIEGKDLGKLPLVTSIDNFLNQHFKLSGVVLIDVQGSKIYVDSRDTGVAPFLLKWGIHEKYETMLFKKLIKKGMVVVDIGANFGYYTLLAARLVGDEGKVFAFEPDPYNYSLLAKNIGANGYNNVIPVQKAILHKSGKMKLFLDKNNLGAHSLSEPIPSNKGGSILVEVISLDEFFKDKDYTIDVIKMDVEGSEMKVLQGMTNLINKNDNLKIITEFWPIGLRKSGSSPTEFLNKLKEYGFTLYQIGRSLEPIDINHVLRMCGDERFTNLFCKKR